MVKRTRMARIRRRPLEARDGDKLPRSRIIVSARSIFVADNQPYLGVLQHYGNSTRQNIINDRLDQCNVYNHVEYTITILVNQTTDLQPRIDLVIGPLVRLPCHIRSQNPSHVADGE